MNFPTEFLQSFVAIVDSGSFTSAARAVHRTQSAVSMQVKRLEEAVGKPIFIREGRSVTLTSEGEMLLGYARRMVKLHEETVAAFLQPDVTGEVRIGTPDDYAMRFLPGILERFSQVYPRVQVAVRCEPTSRLREALERGELDLTLLTGPGHSGNGELLRRDPTVWVTSERHFAHEQDPLPLAIFYPECFHRDWAFAALDGAGRIYRIAYQSHSMSGLLAAVSAGLAVTVLVQSIVPQSMRVLGEEEGFPSMPESSIILQRGGSKKSRAIDCLASHIIEGVRAEPGAGF